MKRIILIVLALLLCTAALAEDMDMKYDFSVFTNVTLNGDEAMDKNRPLLELLERYAAEKGATPAQISLAWEITKKPYIIPIPGTTKMERVKENIGGLSIELTDAEMQEIEVALSQMDIVGMHS